MKQKVLAIGDLSQYVEPGVPVGFVGYWMGTVNNIPEGWFICNGSTFDSTLYPELYKALNNTTQIPDMSTSKRFIRCSSVAGVKQSDAIRNITGRFDTDDNLKNYLSGAFYAITTAGRSLNAVGDNYKGGVGFDASRVVPTASENRPINISAIPIIKHD